MKHQKNMRWIWCAGCNKETHARLTLGHETYPGNHKVRNLPFWKCDSCQNWVGCHHKTKHRTRPLGVIADAELRKARHHLHRLIDPLWTGKGRSIRRKVYRAIEKNIGWKANSFHVADIRTVGEAREIYRTIKGMIDAGEFEKLHGTN